MVGKHNILYPNIQGVTLAKLVCTNCKKYLSVTPIYSHPTLGTICGRCPVPGEDKNFTRNDIYEVAIEFQKFPCVNRSFGCLEDLFPGQVKRHENQCPYRKFHCPTKIHNNCTWQGTLDTLLDHFKDKHPPFLLQDGQFEIDFINSHSENYIMIYEDDIFVVTRQANPQQKMFAITVTNLGSGQDVDKYTIIVTLESGSNKAYNYAVSMQVGTCLELQGASVTQALQDPITIIANITIKAEVKDTHNIDEDGSYKNPLVNYEMLETLECPVCFEYLVSSIYQCEYGHSICGTCKDTQQQCPTCRGPFNNTKNFALEKLTESMMYPCKNKGCTFATLGKDIKQHEARCLLGSFKCPLHDYHSCEDIFLASALFDHIKSKHYEDIMELDTINLPFDDSVTEDINECYILRFSQHLFKLCFTYDVQVEEFKWVLQIVGPPEDAQKYKFELEIIDNSGKNNKLYIKSCCDPMSEYEWTGVHLLMSQLYDFIENQLSYRIKILTESY